MGSFSAVLNNPRNEDRGEFDSADDRRRAADTKRGQLASSLGRHLLCIMGETMDFPDLKTKTSD